MKKTRYAAFIYLRYFSIIFVIAFGLIAFVGCGGGGDDAVAPVPNPGVIDNSPFWGEFAVSMTTDSCEISNFTMTLGGDSTRKNEEGYIYLPKDQSSITYSQPDRTFTLERSGLTIYFAEDGQDYTAERTLAFSNDYNNFTITNGWVEDDDPADCDGTEAGTGIRVGTVGVTIDFNYLQYRSSNTFNGNRGYVELTKDGIPVEQSDIKNIELKDSSGALVNLDSVNFFPSTYFNGMWNSATVSLDFSGPASFAGFGISFPQGFDLPADDYTLEVTTSDNKLLSNQINYPGQKVLPFVDSATMTSQLLADGSLKLSWTNPPNNPPGDYDQLRVVISDQVAGEMLYASLPVNVNEMTIPSDWVKIFEGFYSPTTVRWQVQTRSYTAEDMNYARGISDWVIIPEFAPAVTIDFNYLQYRTPSNQYRGYIELTKNGIPVVQADINKIELKDSSGALVNFDTVSFFPSTYYVGMWNSVTASVDFSGPVSVAGFGISFPGAFNLPADDYTLEVTTIYNKPVSKQTNYPGQKVLPFVDSATMTSQ
ncbi:MAG: hypothetical protein OQJ93_14110, partial [Ignavibacteriaceae bacterium]|nr:hypothetical protein [Ignavibacteriaceae bacterium]